MSCGRMPIPFTKIDSLEIEIFYILKKEGKMMEISLPTYETMMNPTLKAL
jgi:hypothetical protein